MLIKKIFVVLLVLPIFSFAAFSLSASEISGRSAVLINAETNEVIYEKNADLSLSMASTTKIMTSLLAIESGRLNCLVEAEKDVICEGTAIGIKKGDCFTLETLVYAMLLESGNDAAVLTAQYLAGSEEEFAELMNSKANKIGMKNTNFVTSSGLDDESHYTTAYDMALLGSYAVKNPVFKKICSTKNYKAEYINPDISVTYSNHNKLLSYYDGVFGIKTGFTKKSGRCLVSACEKDGVTLVSVTLNAGDDWNDHIKLYDYGYSILKTDIFSADIPKEIKIYGGEKFALKIGLKNYKISKNKDDKTEYRIRMKQLIYAPIKINDIIGFVDVTVNGVTVESIPVYALEGINEADNNTEPKFSFMYKLKNIF